MSKSELLIQKAEIRRLIRKGQPRTQEDQGDHWVEMCNLGYRMKSEKGRQSDAVGNRLSAVRKEFGFSVFRPSKGD